MNEKTHFIVCRENSRQMAVTIIIIDESLESFLPRKPMSWGSKDLAKWVSSFLEWTWTTRECQFAHEMYVLPNCLIATCLVTISPSSNNYIINLIDVWSYSTFLLYRTMSLCWPGGRTRTQRVWLSFTTRHLCGMMIHNHMCSTSTAESRRPLSRISKSYMTMTVSAIHLIYNFKYNEYIHVRYNWYDSYFVLYKRPSGRL